MMPGATEMAAVASNYEIDVNDGGGKYIHRAVSLKHYAEFLMNERSVIVCACRLQAPVRKKTLGGLSQD